MGNKNIIITGGGTGGHLFSALALADYLKKLGYNPIIVGSMFGIESKILKDEPFEYILLNTMGFMGKNFSQKAKSAINIAFETLRSILILKNRNPFFIIGFGGYTTIPVILASKWLHIKCGIVEQNAIPGRANRFFSKFIDNVFINFKQTLQYFDSKKTFIVGNPIRLKPTINKKNFDNLDNLRIGVVGGSRGANKINLAMMEFASLTKLNISVIHQTGYDKYKAVFDHYAKIQPHWKVYPFISDMNSFYKNIDFVISRAGAGSLAEIACYSLPSLLVPYPYAIYNHQYENAKIFEDSNAAFVMDDKNLSGKNIENIILSLKPHILKKMSLNVKLFCNAKSCEEIVDVMLKKD